MKKYELTSETKEIYGTTLYRIRALIDFGDVKCGDLGGWIEKESNLSHEGTAWINGDAWVYGDAQVYGDARLYGDARVYDNARVYGNAWVCGDARVYGNALVYGDAWVCDDARVYGDAWLYGDAQVYGDAEILSCNHYRVFGPAGSRNDFTTFFRAKDLKIYVKCGCFLGTIDEFERKVAETHGDNQYAQEYRDYANIARKYIDLSPTAE